MAGRFADLYAKFDKLPDAKRRELDNALVFLEHARLPTEQGAANRSTLAMRPLDAGNARILGAYAAYRYRTNQPPNADTKQWEANQLDRFASLVPQDAMSENDVSDSERLAAKDAQARKLLGPKEFIGPPQAQPWDNWTPKQRLQADRMIEALDGAMIRRHGKAMGVGSEWEAALQNIQDMGGIDPELAGTLARYKMQKQGMVTPTGPRVIDNSDQEKEARRDAFLAMTPEQQGSDLKDQKAMGAMRSAEARYDELTAKGSQ